MRDWIEIGKMHKRLSDISESIRLDTYDDGSSFVLVEIRGSEYTYDGSSAREAITKAYFELVLGVDDSEQIEFDITPEILDELYRRSDEEEIPVDELITNILTEYIELLEKEEKKIRKEEKSERDIILDEIFALEKSMAKNMSVDMLKLYLDMVKTLLGK